VYDKSIQEDIIIAELEEAENFLRRYGDLEIHELVIKIASRLLVYAIFFKNELGCGSHGVT